MTELIYKNKVIEPPYLVRKYGVSEEEFDRFTDEDIKADLLDGVLIIHSPASIRHEDLFGFLYFLIRGYAEHRELGKVFGSRATMHLAYCRKFEPDILFIRSEKLDMLRQNQLEGPADMVVEILSEGTKEYDLKEKRPIYQEAGIEEIWFVDDEERRILIDRKCEDGYTTETVVLGRAKSQVIPGFFVEAEWLWKEKLPEPSFCLREILEAGG